MSLYFCQFWKKATCTLYSDGSYTACVIDLDWLNSNGSMKHNINLYKRKNMKDCFHTLSTGVLAEGNASH